MHYQGKERFPCTNRPRQKKLSSCTTAWYKSRFIFPRKPLGSETTKCPSLAKRVLQMAEKPCRQTQKNLTEK
jgi:hypothetical protein